MTKITSENTINHSGSHSVSDHASNTVKSAPLNLSVRHLLRRGVRPLSALTACTFIALATLSATASQHAAARSITHNLSIPTQPLSEALKALSVAANEQLLFKQELVEGKQSVEITGQYTTDQALGLLLAGSGLQADRTPSGVLLIRDPSKAVNSAKIQGKLPTTSAVTTSGNTGGLEQDKQGFWGKLRLAQNSQETNQNAGFSSSAEDLADRSLNELMLEELIVTATRREEKLRDVAGSVAALSGEQLTAAGAQEFADYLTRIPSVAFSNGPSGASTAVIRGVGTTAGLDQGQGATGYFINDIPLTEPGYATGLPDIDAFDVQRVEVLRGPAGTLFGSASLGGAINYIANTADASGLHMAMETSVGSTYHSAGDINHALKAMINVPLIDNKLAARLVYTNRTQAGYLDNVGVDERGSNDLNVEGWRLSLAYTPSERTKLTYLGLYQRNATDDFSVRLPALGDYARSTPFLAPTTFGTNLQNLRLDQDLGFATLTTSAAVVRKTDDQYDDFGIFYAFLNLSNPLIYEALLQSKTTVFEARLASPKGERFDWVFGAMKMHVTKAYDDYLYARNAQADITADAIANGLPAPDASLFTSFRGVDAVGLTKSDTSGNESAVFGEANFHFGAGLTLTAGGRLFKTDSSTRTNYDGYANGGQLIGERFSVDDDGFAPKVSLAYRKDGLLVYGLASQGFRFGSANTIFPLAGFDTPRGTTSDSLWNYEVGTRFDLFDHRAQLDLTAFTIDWTNLQLRLTRPDGFTYAANAGAARINGAEATLTVRPVSGLLLAANIGYLDAKLTEDVPTTSLKKDQTLPSSAKWRISSSASYSFDAARRPTVTMLHRYVSEVPGYINQPFVFDAYNIFDARASIEIGDIVVAAFVENIGNKDAVTFGYGDYGLGVTEYIVRPRTYGLQINWSL